MSFAEITMLVGGLGLFLLGMTQMSDGVEKVAGAKLRSLLELFTTNKYLGILVGILFTGLVQSSSACTSMVVSFVNSGLMNLYQAAGVIFGSNIGTTITGQLVSIDLAAYAPLILFAGVCINLFFKNQTVKRVGDVIIGFGVLFIGIEMMSGAMETMKESDEIREIFSRITNPFLGVMIGFAVTAVIQSSSATVGILIKMADEALFPNPEICLFIILGCNIGSCVTALIASLAGKKEAKRAALIHLLFNIFGTIIMFTVLQIFMDPIAGGIQSISADDGRFVANAHTIFKVTQVITLLPFMNGIVKLTYKILPGDDEKVGYRDNFRLQYIGDGVLFNPSTAVVDGMKELERMASLASDNLNRAMNALITLDEEDIKEVYETEQNINFLNRSITKYLVDINQSTLPIEDLQGIGSLFHVANDIERIGDHAENIVDMAVRRKELGVSFSEDAQKELADMLAMVNVMIEKSIRFMLRSESDEFMEELYELEASVDKKEKELQQHHIDRLTKQECTPEAGMLFSDVISGLERVADHALNISTYILHKDNAGVATGAKV